MEVPVIIKLAVEYLNDLASSGITNEVVMKGAVKEYLVLDDEEIEKVWERWENTQQSKS